MAQNIIIDGNKLEGVEELSLLNDKGEEVAFSEGTALDDVLIELDFSDGDQSVVAGDGYLVKSAIIQKPYNLVPENIVKDKNVAGVIGTATGGGGGDIGNTFIIVDSEGTEVAAVLVDDEVAITATPADVRAGKTFISDNGVETGMAVIDEGGGGAVGDHLITFMDETGTNVLYTKPVIHGDTSANPVTLGSMTAPTKESTQQYKYTFSGWASTPGGNADSSVLNSITESKTVYAAFTSSLITYTIRFYDGDTIIKAQSLAYGATPTPPTPTKGGYTFIGWDKDIVAVTGSTSYYAQWQLALEGIKAYGNFGDGLMWQLTDENELNIYGKGPMPTFGEPGITTLEPAPWLTYASDIVAVTIEDGIKSIGQYAFYGCTSLTAVTIPNSVLHIYARAFNTCTALASINVGSGVTEIPNYCFAGCSLLSAIEMPSVTSIGAGAFNGCAFTTFVTSSIVKTIGDQAFYNCSLLQSITIGLQCTKIGRQAFYGCSALATASFRDTSGWMVSLTNDFSYGNYSSLTSSNLSDTAKAATYLKETHVNKYWSQ